jgi:hypothetical protein
LSVASDGTVTYVRLLDEIPTGLGLLAEARNWLFPLGPKDGKCCAEEVILLVDLVRQLLCSMRVLGKA